MLVFVQMWLKKFPPTLSLCNEVIGFVDTQHTIYSLIIFLLSKVDIYKAITQMYRDMDLSLCTQHLLIGDLFSSVSPFLGSHGKSLSYQSSSKESWSAVI